MLDDYPVDLGGAVPYSQCRLNHIGPNRRIQMRVILFFISAFVLSSCVTAPSYQQFSGGAQVEQPGVSFVLPTEKSWSAIIRSGYQISFGANERMNNETFIDRFEH